MQGLQFLWYNSISFSTGDLLIAGLNGIKNTQNFPGIILLLPCAAYYLKEKMENYSSYDGT